MELNFAYALVAMHLHAVGHATRLDWREVEPNNNSVQACASQQTRCGPFNAAGMTHKYPRGNLNLLNRRTVSVRRSGTILRMDQRANVVRPAL